MSVIVKEVTAIGREITTINRRTRSFCTFNWIIPQFVKICPKGTINFPMLKSPIFTAGEDMSNKSQWTVIVWGIDACLAINLQLSPTSTINEAYFNHGLQCKFTTSLGNSCDRFEKSYTTEHLFDKDFDRWGFVRFADISEIFDHEDTLLEDGTLRICVQMEIEAALDRKDTVDSICRNQQLQLQKLAMDFERLLESPNNAFSDIKINCGGSVFQCHKNVLAARSSVFNAIMHSQVMEITNNEIVIDDLLPSTLSALLTYMYTGKVEIPVSDFTAWTALIHGAQKYDLRDLKNICFEEMLGGLCEENAGTFVVASYLYGAPEEIRNTVNKFCLEHIKALIHDPNFKDLLAKYPLAFFSI